MNTPDTQHHILVKAVVTQATDEGLFSAVISTASVDRDGDIVEPSAVVKALQAWAPAGKKVPLAWDHQYDTDFIIGHIEPGSVKATPTGEVEADGWIDQSIPRGKDAWRLVRSGTLGFSYGFLINEWTPRGAGQGKHITALDIFEVTATPIPANADTRVISYKNIAELKDAMAAIEQEEEERVIPDVGDPPPVIPVEPIVVAVPERAQPLPAEVLNSVASAIEREEEERQLPEVDPPPEPEPHTPPAAPPVPKDVKTLAAAAAAVEREEQERQLPTDVVVTPLPAPAPEPEPAPAPVLAPDQLKKVADEIERREEERKVPEAEVEVEPEPEDLTDLEGFLTGKGVTEDALLTFARTVLAKHGTSLEDLEVQVKRLEREERTQRETAIVKSAEVESVQAQVADAREAVVALEHFEPSEVEGMKSGILTTVWTAAYLNALPNSAFLHSEKSGLRHFPYKDAGGNVDLPHLRNALARIPQSDLPPNVKDKLAARAQRILDNAKTVDVTHKEKGAPGRGSREVDPLRKQADDVALEFHSDGLDRHKPPRQVEQPKQKPEKSLDELRQQMFDETLTLLSD